MTVQSMTGFARDEGQIDGVSWVWEIRSVNGKSLDVRLRLPAGFEALDVPARKLLAERFRRGNIQASLQVTQSAGQLSPKINNDLALELMQAAKRLQADVGGALPTTADIMNMRGVVEFEDHGLDEEGRVKRDAAVMDSFAKALKAIEDTRVKEGQAIAKVLADQVSGLEQLRSNIEASDARSPEAINKTLARNVSRLVDANGELDPQRLHQEAILLAAKADLQEELDRLQVHVQSARDLLSGDGPVGRKLDFLAQEFNRECNTICSKSNDAQVTAIGLDMKLLIDQFREQVQNME